MSFGELEVLLVDAKGLKDTDLIGKMDPYVEIQYRDQQQKSKVAYTEGGGNPRWNQKFKFKIHHPLENNSIRHKLVLRVMDRDTFSADDFVGEATINVGDVIALGLEKGFMEVNPCKYRVVLSDKRYHGEIRVGVTFKLINLTKVIK
ncbi:elicitor-responsive protein 1-like isoform X1 [Zingiber officinale]|uniref:elicitor-responsive protein 1-like isoform X1 n=1 Tax=Zingiber officinale TaxID=94328 RepID=UPI001C4D2402|nr:elicitor-responsive protein 1-like isoform X1 [Zingiber officinale]